MKNVLIIQKNIPHYRIEFFNDLNKSKDINLSVFSLNDEHLLSSDSKSYNFIYKKIKQIKLLSFSFYLFRYPNNFKKNDVVIVVGNIRHLHNYFLFIYCKLRKIKIVWWGIWNMPGRDNAISNLRKKIASFFDHLILYSDVEKKDALTYLKKNKNISSFNNSIKLEYKKKLILKKNNNFFKLLYVGRLTKKPQLDYAINAVKDLVKKDYKIKLNIVGDGPEYNNLRNLVRESDLEKYIYFYGSIYEKNILEKFFSYSDFFIYPGAIGLSIFHSFAYGLPVITHNNKKYQAPEYYLFKNKYNGLSFQHNDLKDLIHKIEYIINKKEDYMYLKDNSLKTVYENYTYESSITKFQNTIIEL